MSSYTVKAGDTLSTIAERVLGHASMWPDIARLNQIAAPYTIYIGQALQLPPTPATLPATSSSSSAPPPAHGPSGAPVPAATGGPGLVHRLMAWAKANPGLAVFWGLSLGLSAAGLYVMVTRTPKRRGNTSTRRKRRSNGGHKSK